VDCIVFDKTGTLTIGKPVTVNTRLLKNMALPEFYNYAAAAEVRNSSLMVRSFFPGIIFMMLLKETIFRIHGFLSCLGQQ
jgi:high-affinity K+ transport system ATPase subunit B